MLTNMYLSFYDNNTLIMKSLEIRVDSNHVFDDLTWEHEKRLDLDFTTDDATYFLDLSLLIGKYFPNTKDDYIYFKNI